MNDGLPWSVKGVEPDIRADAQSAAHAVGLTLGQWLNGVIRDSLVDLRAARAFGPAMRGESPLSSTQQDMARHPMQHYQQPYPYAPMPQMMGAPMMQPPVMQPPVMPPYAMPQPPMMAYPGYGVPPAPAPAYDPIEARLRAYARTGTETAVGSVPGADQRMLSVIDAAMDAMQSNMRATEKKTAEALGALASLVEKTRDNTPTPAKAPPVDDTARDTARVLASLVDRLSDLERKLTEPRAEPATARQLEERIGEALDALARDAVSPARAEVQPLPAGGEIPPAAPVGVRPPPRREAAPPAPPAPRPRAAVAAPARGANAIAEIAARQRALDLDTTPQAQAGPEHVALDAIRKSIAALADQVREQRRAPAETGTGELRNELKEVQKALQGLAPRDTVASVNEQLRILSQKIEEGRRDTGQANAFAPVEKLMADMNAAVKSLGEPRGLEAVGTTLQHMAKRIDDLGARSIDARQIAEIQRQLADMRTALTDARTGQPTVDLHREIARLSAKLDSSVCKGGDSRELGAVAAAVDEMRRNIGRLDPDEIIARIDERLAGIDGLENRLGDLARRIEDTRAPALDQNGLDTITRQIERMTQSLAARPAVADLNPLIARIDDLRHNLGRAQPAQDLSEVVARIDDMRQMLARGPAQPDLSQITARIDDLRERMAHAGPGPDLTPITARIDDLRERMAHAGPGPDLTPITARIDDLRERLAHAGPGPDLSQITARIDDLRERLTRVPPGPDMAALERRIADLQAAVQQRQAQPDMKGLEQILRKLADRIETVRAPAADTASLDALQQQIVTLAGRLEQAGGANPALGGLERMLGDLVQRVSSLKDVTAAAAQNAVREAMVQTPMAGGMDTLAAEGMMLIKRDLTEMKSAQVEADGRSRETLQLVNTTLEKIVSRLSALESEMQKPRAAPAAAMPAAMPAATLAGNHDRIAPPLSRPAQSAPQAASPAPAQRPPMMDAPPAADGELDLPMEPGSGRSGTPLGAPGEAAADPRSTFIAAARRAAQAAAAQTSATLSELDAKKGLKGAVDGKLGGVKAYLASRRKPLLLGLAALVFALGGLKVATSVLGTDEPETTGALPTVKVTPGKLAEEPQAPLPARQAAAPKRDSLAESYDKRLDTAEQVVARANIPKMAMPADPTVTGSVPGAMPTLGPREPAQGLPAEAGEIGAKPADIAALMRQTPFNGPERLRQAAANGNFAAMYEIGSRMAEGRGVTRDLKGAAQWFEFAANQGYVPAQYRFGSFNREGLGLPKDSKTAYVWFQRAAEQGHILAMHNLAVLHAEGVNGQPDYASAAAWFRTAAEHGVKDSQFNIAILHVRGMGVEQNLVEAYKWFAAAAAQGDADAAKKRDELETKMTPDKLAEAKAVADAYRAKRPDPRANEVSTPDGGWDQTARTPAPAAPTQKKTRT